MQVKIFTRCSLRSYGLQAGLIIQSLSQITNLVSADEHLGPHREGEVPRPRLAAAQVPPPAPHTGVLSAELPRLHILVSTQIYISLHTLYRSRSRSSPRVVVSVAPPAPPLSHSQAHVQAIIKTYCGHSCGLLSLLNHLFCCYNLFIYIKSYSF